MQRRRQLVSEVVKEECPIGLNRRVQTNLSDDTDEELLKDIYQTEGDLGSIRVRNWMRDAFEAKREVERLRRMCTVESFAVTLMGRIEHELAQPKVYVFNFDASELAKEYKVREYIVHGAVHLLDEDRKDWFIGQRGWAGSFFVRLRDADADCGIKAKALDLTTDHPVEGE